MIPALIIFIIMYVLMLTFTQYRPWIALSAAAVFVVMGLIGLFDMNIMSAFLLAMVLFVLLIILGVTSFNFVKKKMDPHSWKKIQKMAYPFFMLTYVHLLLMLLPSALHGGQAAIVTVSMYSVVFIGYAVLRIRRAMIDKRHEEEAAAA